MPPAPFATASWRAFAVALAGMLAPFSCAFAQAPGAPISSVPVSSVPVSSVPVSRALMSVAKTPGAPSPADQIAAQVPAELTGTVVRRGWPDRLPEGRAARRYAALPSMDTLALGYRIADAGAAPLVDVAFRWTPGESGLLDGRTVDFERLPSGLRLVAFVLTADLVQNGRRIGGLTVEVDSTRLGPDQTLRIAPEVAWSHLFDGLSATEARQAVADGATLTNLRLARAAFAVFGTTRTARGRSSRAGRADRTRSGEDAAYRTVIVLDAVTDVLWDLAWLYDTGGPRHGYSGVWSSVYDALEDADGDDDTELLPAALAGVAVVGVAAWQAGSLGVYGADGAPLGVMGGYTGSRLGIYVQAGVSASVLGLADRPEVAQGRMLGYVRPRGWRVAPLVGVGAEVNEAVVCGSQGGCETVDGLDSRAVVTLGLAVPLRRSVLLLGADAATWRFQAGLVARLR